MSSDLARSVNCTREAEITAQRTQIAHRAVPDERPATEIDDPAAPADDARRERGGAGHLSRVIDGLSRAERASERSQIDHRIVGPAEGMLFARAGRAAPDDLTAPVDGERQ